MPAIAASAVTTAKIADANVTAGKLAKDAVTTEKIAYGAVTLAKQANIATASLLGRTTAGTGATEVLTATAARTLLALENVSNTSDANKPVSNATQTALDLKAPLASPALTDVPTAPTAAALTNTTQIATTAFVTAAISTAATPDATDLVKGKIQLAGDLAGTAALPTVTNAAVIGKVLTGYTSGAGTVTDADNILQAVQKLNGNDALKAPLASPTFTGSVSVNGSATNTTAFNAAASTNIVFTNSNLAYTSANPGSFTLTGIKDGGTYTLAVQGTTSGTSTFAATDFTFLSGNNGPSTAGKQTLYTFIVMGTTVYYFMAIGF